jgi:phosphoribosylformylglycinamidine synthase I
MEEGLAMSFYNENKNENNNSNNNGNGNSEEAVNFLILSGDGINCERETKYACELAGGVGKIMHINDLLQNKHELVRADAIVFPGGFSFGDQLGSGKILGLKMKHALVDELKAIVEKQTPVLGICNGFQVLLHLGLLPDPAAASEAREVSLMQNQHGKFIDRWVELKIHQDTPCVWTKYASASEFRLPIRHKEGNLQISPRELATMKEKKQIVFQYIGDSPALNGATESIAGICDETGHILGMMPHPEAYVSPFITPPGIQARDRDRDGNDDNSGNEFVANGLMLFKSVVQYLRKEKEIKRKK